MDKSPRLAAILPVKLTIGTESNTHFVHTMDISASGVKVVLPFNLDRGRDVVLEYKKKRARAVVIWSKPMRRNANDYAIGMQLLDDGQKFWLVDLGPKAHILESMGQRITERPRASNE
ncbi:MAG TPA: PilZ domain-containing protein [Terriglobales bacterium]|nr:PilZ domain-containing protein [Terriglobales bacterium]